MRTGIIPTTFYLYRGKG